MKKCPRCGYERTQEDDAFISVAECPKCGVIYEKEIAYIDKRRKIVEEERLIAEEKLKAEELKEAARQQNEVNASSTMKNCPYCAEEIKYKAVKCRYCGEWLNQQTAKQNLSAVKSKFSDSLNFIDKVLSRWHQKK